MLLHATQQVSTHASRTVRSIRRPQMLLAFPVVLGLAFLLGGQAAIAFVGLAFPVTLALALPPNGTPGDQGRDALTGLRRCEDAVEATNIALAVGQ